MSTIGVRQIRRRVCSQDLADLRQRDLRRSTGITAETPRAHQAQNCSPPAEQLSAHSALVRSTCRNGSAPDIRISAREENLAVIREPFDCRSSDSFDGRPATSPSEDCEFSGGTIRPHRVFRPRTLGHWPMDRQGVATSGPRIVSGKVTRQWIPYRGFGRWDKPGAVSSQTGTVARCTERLLYR